METSRGTLRLTWLHAAWIALAALALCARLLPGERTIDDAYITYRYAENLVAGRGLVYNPGERVLGTTTPLYTLLLAAETALLPGVQLPPLSRVTNALAGTLSVLVLAWMGKRVLGQPGLGLAAGLLWAISPMAVTFSVGGMETPFYVLLLLAALAAYGAGWTYWSAAFCALATWTRPDALLLVGPLFVHMAWHERRVPWREGLLYAGLLLPWVVFATLYFGSPLPHSMLAKSAAYHLAPYSALVRLIQHYATPFFEHHVLGTRWVGVGMVLYPFLSLVGGLALVRDSPPLNPPRKTHGGEEGPAAARLLPLVVYPWVYFVALSVYNPLVFRWYLAPVIPMYTLCILAGGQKLLRDLAGRVGKLLARHWDAAATGRDAAATGGDAAATRHRDAAAVGRVCRGLEVVLVLVLAGMLVCSWQIHPDHGPDRPAPEMAWFKLEQLYHRATQDLVARHAISAETYIAAGDIGVIGYESGARILDTVGLVSRQAAGHYPLPDEAYVIAYAIPTDLILDEQPDYLVALEVYVRDTLLRSEAFRAQYELDRRWETDIYGSDGLLVYRRRGD